MPICSLSKRSLLPSLTVLVFINSIFGLQRSKMPSVSEGFLEQT